MQVVSAIKVHRTSHKQPLAYLIWRPIYIYRKAEGQILLFNQFPLSHKYYLYRRTLKLPNTWQHFIAAIVFFMIMFVENQGQTAFQLEALLLLLALPLLLTLQKFVVLETFADRSQQLLAETHRQQQTTQHALTCNIRI